ncbi:hypothetical protein K2X96_02145 [Patescibacteria group bacterium]|nr:hypothetical protein [Patescibacteria group bacterium]
MINPLYISKITDQSWHRELVESMWKQGYVMLSDFLTPDAFSELRATGERLANKKTIELQGSIADRLAHSEEFMALFNGLHKIRAEKEGKDFVPLQPERQMIGFPYKDARDGKRTEETEYHYDGAYANATLALKMPETGGELIAFPNLRTSKNAFLIKLFSRALRHVPFLRRVVPHIIARSRPNDLCLFFGDRTFHGVEPIESGERLILTINSHW